MAEWNLLNWIWQEYQGVTYPPIAHKAVTGEHWDTPASSIITENQGFSSSISTVLMPGLAEDNIM